MAGLAMVLAAALAIGPTPPATVTPDVNPGTLHADSHVVQPPAWLDAPNSDLLSMQFPPTAMAMRQTGRVILQCRVMRTGLLSLCQTVSEFPVGLGFGDAALRLTPTFHFRPQLVDGQPTDDGVVKFPINFALPPMPRKILWARAPSESEVMRNWPEYDVREHVGGTATFQCAVMPSGALHRCVVLSELPPNRGFAEAALRLTTHFRTEPYELGASGQETRVTVPILWNGIGDTGEYVPAHDVVVAKVPWTSTPMRADIAAAYPTQAAAAKLAGSASLRCQVANDGSLVNCIDGVDLPAEAGFGKAARLLVGKFRTETTYQNVSLVGAYIDIDISFLPVMLDDQPIGFVNQGLMLNGPNAATIVAAFPEMARREGLSQGSVALDCSIGRDGSLTDCAVAGEMPANLGFGAAGKALAQQVRLVAWDGTPLAGRRVHFPIRIYSTPPSGLR